MPDLFNSRATLATTHGTYTIFRLDALEKAGLTTLSKLPFSIRILLEQVLRQADGEAITEQHIRDLAGWQARATQRPVVPFKPARVLMQDFTGVPAVVDLAAMRSAVARLGGNPKKVNPVVPVDLVIDHSVQVDFFGLDALARNAELEFERNRERYEFLHWGKNAFDNFRVVPPATGIVHQVNLEYLAQVVMTKPAADGGYPLAFPDTVVGTDSHTTMINGLGVLGWGVGGIEAEAAVVGVPLDMVAPDVVGFRLHGKLGEGVTATDLVLTVTQMLRKKGVVEKFVEFHGPGLDSMSLPDRATIANMAPEYGATIGYFPVDDETIRYLRLTGRPAETVALVEAYCKAQGLYRTADTPDPEFTDTLELDMGTVIPSLAGPKLPQQRIGLGEMSRAFHEALTAPKSARGFELPAEALGKTATLGANPAVEMKHGAVIIAAITSCTNTSNPSVMLGAGLLAKKAAARGLTVKPYVKTSLAPGSQVVTEYLEHAGLLEPLAQLGFNVVGYGCTTCIGNSGPLPGEVVQAVQGANLVAAAVLSGNRNFEGRVHPYSLANYLASPPLVVAFALAGTVDINLDQDPIGHDPSGAPVYLREIWPSPAEVQAAISQSVQPGMFVEKYSNVFDGNPTWNAIPADASADLYAWDEASTYIQEPPFFTTLTPEVKPIEPIRGARVLVKVGDNVTTDHISPAGSIPANFPAGAYLQANGVALRDFNSFGARRGNDRVMTRGTFGNIRLKNHLAGGKEGSWTVKFPEWEEMFIYDAALKYQAEGTPLVILAGKEYGTGSSRDWAAKGTLLLGVRAVIAESYERIHRSNLVGMGVLPLEFPQGENAASLGLDGSEEYDIELDQTVRQGQAVTVNVARTNGEQLSFAARLRLDTPVEVKYYQHGGILHKAIRDML
jgi:aconitate hydratase